jgi:hypothetical protein
VRWIGRGGRLTSGLSAQRDVAAAKAFFRIAIKGQHDAPRTIPLDGYAASHRAVRELKADGWLPAQTKLRSSKSLNNLIEQDHRGVKQRIATMLGFNGFATAAITIAGIELTPRIPKGQFGLGRLGVQGRLAPAVGMPCSKLEVSTLQRGTLSGAGYLHQSPSALTHSIVEGLWAPGTQGGLRGLPGGAEGIRPLDRRARGL